MSDKIDPFENIEEPKRDEYGFSDDETITTEDNPFWDGTDAAHPAWWRGCDRGSVSIIELVYKFLTIPIENYDLSGQYNNRQLNFIKNEIHKIRKTIGFLEKSSFDNYSQQAHKLAIWPQDQELYPVLGLAEESGEVVGKFKKMLRDDDGVMTDERRESIIKELGDVLWYLNEVALLVGSNLDEVAETNIKKLNKRAENNTIKGSGDDR